MQPKRYRMAVSFVPSGQWTANAHYFKNVLAALRVLEPNERPDVFLLVPPGTGPSTFSELHPWIDGVLEHELFPQWAGVIKRTWGHVCRRTGCYENPLSLFLRKKRIDAVFGGMEFGEGFRVPLLTWIADFQHLHLQAMFSGKEITERDQRLMRLARYADRIVLNSQDALADLSRFAPGEANKARVVPFVSMVDGDSLRGDPQSVCREYNLPKRFIYLPNQFWRHKNHRLVLQSLDMLKAAHPDVVVVCTGNTNDYRAPTYFGGLIAEISRMGLRERMIVVGLVPHSDVFRLLRQSVAVLQPSLFEGWNTIVEECKSVGKSMIVSDLAVHREQNPPNALYFTPTDAGALADCLVRVYREWKSGPDVELETAAQRLLQLRTKAFAEAFMAIMCEAVEGK